jgi:hypothetical protein
MRKTLLILTLMGVCLPAGARADVLDVPAIAATARGDLPVRGQTMGTVTRLHGQPREKHAPVGGDSAKHPPITRWDYDGFSVVFERSHVVDVVIAGAPMNVQRVDELTPAP